MFPGRRSSRCRRRARSKGHGDQGQSNRPRQDGHQASSGHRRRGYAARLDVRPANRHDRRMHALTLDAVRLSGAVGAGHAAVLAKFAPTRLATTAPAATSAPRAASSRPSFGAGWIAVSDWDDTAERSNGRRLDSSSSAALPSDTSEVPMPTLPSPPSHAHIICVAASEAALSLEALLPSRPCATRPPRSSVPRRSASGQHGRPGYPVAHGQVQRHRVVLQGVRRRRRVRGGGQHGGQRRRVQQRGA